MTKALFTKFRYFFLLIFFLHFAMIFLHIQTHENKPHELTQAPIKVRILNELNQKHRQIVASEEPLVETTPKEKAYLSDKNRAFDRETKARIVKSFETGKRGHHGKKEISLADLGGEIAKKNPLHKAAKEYSNALKGMKADSNGRTVSSTSDYLENVPVSDLTHLNTVEYKFYGYYFRIRQKLEGFWGRSVQEKAALLATKGRAIASEDEHVTALRIVMNGEGEIVDVVVLGSSGVKELDDAAIESFNDAGPFPNPPKDLIVDGRVTIEWGFVVNS